MATLTVGTGQSYSTITAALAAAQNGDTINVNAGTYLNDFPATISQSVTLVGIGGMAHMSGTVPIPNGKAFLVTGTDATSTAVISITNFEFSGAAVSSNNGAGVRYQGGHLILNGCYFHDNQEGILGGADQTVGIVDINNCEFYNNGFGDGSTHNIYLEVNALNLNNVYSHSANVGHELKSRAATTTVLNSRFQDENGTASYCLDFPNGGNVTVSNCVIQKGVNSSNHTCMIAYGEEGAVQTGSVLSISGNTLINDCPALHEAVWNDTTVVAKIASNSQWAVATMLAGPGTVLTTTALTVQPTLVTTHPWPVVVTPIPTIASILALCTKLNAQLSKNPTAKTMLATIVADLKLL